MPVTIGRLKEKGGHVSYHQFTNAQEISPYIQALNSLDIQDYGHDIKYYARALFEFSHKSRDEKIIISSERSIKHFMIFKIEHIANSTSTKYPTSITFTMENLVELTKNLYKTRTR